ncbi:unnamed protein product [Moneuplotes crassus]|uniref:Uncharacterized protein n=1 Tax=Euplotes crassus TaxID=5936 RepID=A0AAD2CWC6_EUPCR|nr:unnamed protein product [Moneuplotes crassus]
MMSSSSYSVKISMGIVAANLVLGLLSLLAHSKIVVLAEDNLIFKTSILAGVSLMVFQYSSEETLQYFNVAIDLTGFVYGCFEVCQFINLSFFISRRIYYDRPRIYQLPFLISTTLFCGSLICAVYLHFISLSDPQNGTKEFLFIFCCILGSIACLCICNFLKKSDSNILNGGLFCLFTAHSALMVLNDKSNPQKSNLPFKHAAMDIFNNLESRLTKLSEKLAKYLPNFLAERIPAFEIPELVENTLRSRRISSLLGVVLILTTPLTKYEWFKDGSVPTKFEDRYDIFEAPENLITWKQRKSQCFEYLYHALVLLIAANHALSVMEPARYSRYSSRTDLIASFSTVVGISYFVFKLMVSPNLN